MEECLLKRENKSEAEEAPEKGRNTKRKIEESPFGGDLPSDKPKKKK